MSRLCIVAALTLDRVIGINNQLPWHLPADLKHFKALTLGKPVIMGRKTYQSMGKPLVDRRNIVITRHADFVAPGCELVTSLEEALQLTESAPEVMVIGGSQIFAEAMPIADTLYLTLIETSVLGDVFFPHWDGAEWQLVERIDHKPDEKNAYPYAFTTWQRH